MSQQSRNVLRKSAVVAPFPLCASFGIASSRQGYSSAPVRDATNESLRTGNDANVHALPLVDRIFRLCRDTGITETFNALNHPNLSDLNTDPTSPF